MEVNRRSLGRVSSSALSFAVSKPGLARTARSLEVGQSGMGTGTIPELVGTCLEVAGSKKVVGVMGSFLGGQLLRVR